MRKSPDVGVVCNNPDELSSRLWVSGLQAIPTHEAIRRGFHHREPGVIIPTRPHRATREQALGLIATGGTTQCMQIVKIPHAAVGNAVGRYRRAPEDPLPNPMHRWPLWQGLKAAVLEAVTCDPCRLNTSVDTRFPVLGPDGRVAKYALVGDHINKWPLDQSTMPYMFINRGPGELQVRLTPEMSRDRLGVSDPQNWPADMTAYIQRHQNPDDILAYGVTLRPPCDDYAEALLGVPAAYCPMDCATFGSALGSTALILATNEIPVGAFEPLV